MAEGVEVDLVGQPGGADGSLEGMCEAVTSHRAAIVSEDERLAVWLPPDDIQGGIVERDDPASAGLGLERGRARYVHYAPPLVDVSPLEMQDLPLPHSGADGEDDDVTNPGAVHACKKRRVLLAREEHGRAVGDADLCHFAEGVVPDDTPPRRQVEGRPERPDLDVDRHRLRRPKTPQFVLLGQPGRHLVDRPAGEMLFQPAQGELVYLVASPGIVARRIGEYLPAELVEIYGQGPRLRVLLPI